MQPAVMDQPADHGAGDRLRHRPAWCDAVGATPRRIALAQHPVGCRDQNAVGARRAREKMVQSLTQRSRRRLRRLDCIAVGPTPPGVALWAIDWLRVETRLLVRSKYDAAVAGPCQRRADHRFAEIGIGPGDREATVGI